MTKKHFRAIAEIIRKQTIAAKLADPNDDPKLYTELFVNELCNYFKTENELFDDDKFRQACGANLS